MRKIVEKLELSIWVVIFWGVIFLNFSPQLVSLHRVYLLAFLSSMLLFLLCEQFIFQYIAKPFLKNLLRLLSFSVYILIVLLIFTFQKNSLWISCFFPLLLSFFLSLTFVTQPRTLVLLLVMVSIFLLGEIYWESRVPSKKLTGIEFPRPFTRIFSLSLLAIFGYYLYRNQQIIRNTLENYSHKLKNLNEELQRKTTELETTNKRLQELSEAKSVFVATVSHELRTPLTAILNSLKLIGYETKNNEKVKECMEIIKKNIDRQSIMIDNLLDIARIERGVVEIRRSYFELNRLLKEVVEMMRHQANSKKIMLDFSPLEGDSSLWGEDEGLRRVFINLLDNAIKFTPEGGKVDILVNREGENLKVLVSDTGCGIPKQEQEKIFEPFVQVVTERTFRRGIGLGLTIVREIVNRHRGKVWVESEVNRGSKFYVLLPRDLRKVGNE
ncbi:MAG: HAMP domain-containing histidine kinase [Candidatus Omnitrophica bacterium]|nr:HAMP domain-containing histidine kinase [Candidatus Omnitrophota bacterium]MCM8793750.1 HAMP domain-containing histidine kinase [Candidatus Omnitrophota bacterium]